MLKRQIFGSEKIRVVTRRFRRTVVTADHYRRAGRPPLGLIQIDRVNFFEVSGGKKQ